MANIWVMSDPHFGHNMGPGTRFLLEDGRPMRPYNAVEMDELIIQEHNKLVKPSDKFYCLGDVAMKRSYISRVHSLNGHGRLVRGNHDIFPTKYYLAVFEEIYGTRYFEDLLFSHIPIHERSLKNGVSRQMNQVNVHGHIHNNPAPYLGARYLNVCLEMTNYRPLAIEEVRQMKNRQLDAANEVGVG